MNNKANLERLIQDVKDACALSEAEFFAERIRSASTEKVGCAAEEPNSSADPDCGAPAEAEASAYAACPTEETCGMGDDPCADEVTTAQEPDADGVQNYSDTVCGEENRGTDEDVLSPDGEDILSSDGEDISEAAEVISDDASGDGAYTADSGASESEATLGIGDASETESDSDTQPNAYTSFVGESESGTDTTAGDASEPDAYTAFGSDAESDADTAYCEEPESVGSLFSRLRNEEDDDYVPIMSIFKSRPQRHAPRSEVFFEDAGLNCEDDEDEYAFLFEDFSLSRILEKLDMQQRKITDDYTPTFKNFGHTVKCMVLCLLILCLLGGYVLYAHSLRAAVSIKQLELNANAYSMVWSGDYGFESFLESGGASSDEMLMAHLERRFTCGLAEMSISRPENSAAKDSVLSARNSRRLKGTLAGHSCNCDGELMSMVVTTRMTPDIESVSTVNLSLLGYTPYRRPDGWHRSAALAAVYLPLDGMNARGLVVTALERQNGYDVTDTERTDLTATTAVRLLLNDAPDVERAVELLGRYDIFPSFGKCYDFALSDASGRAVVVTLEGGTVTVVECPYAVNDSAGAPLTRSAARNSGNLELLSDTYTQYDGHMTKPQMYTAMRRAAAPGDGWFVVYDTGRLTAEYCFDGDIGRQFTVCLK